MPRPRVIILADTTRPEVVKPLDMVRSRIADHAEVVGEYHANNDPLPEIDADLAVAIGGDGTIMSQARRLVDHDMPLVGVNFGRFGFLAEFDADSLFEHAEIVFGGDPPVHEYMLLQATVHDADGTAVYRGIAVNDVVVTAGPPFRMIELCLSFDDDPGPVLNGDGVIVSSPAGSTAYNVSAGGPIVHPGIEAMIVTPLAVHSLAFRPIVMPAANSLTISVTRANPGTALVVDGQDSFQITEAMTVTIARNHHRAKLVANPRASYWHVLLDKMRWAAPPTYRDRGP